MFVKPAPDLTVRDPVHMRPLRAEGQHVKPNSFWLRRLRDGDVIEAELPASETGEPLEGPTQADASPEHAAHAPQA